MDQRQLTSPAALQRGPRSGREERGHRALTAPVSLPSSAEGDAQLSPFCLPLAGSTALPLSHPPSEMSLVTAARAPRRRCGRREQRRMTSECVAVLLCCHLHQPPDGCVGHEATAARLLRCRSALQQRVLHATQPMQLHLRGAQPGRQRQRQQQRQRQRASHLLRLSCCSRTRRPPLPLPFKPLSHTPPHAESADLPLATPPMTRPFHPPPLTFLSSSPQRHVATHSRSTAPR